MIAKAVLVAFLAFGVVAAPDAFADPTPDDYDDVYGLITPDEKQEIWASGNATCVALDRAYEAGPPLTSSGVIPVIESYRARGWDLESAGDIVWEAVEGRCPEYLDAVKRAVRSYGDPS